MRRRTDTWLNQHFEAASTHGMVGSEEVLEFFPAIIKHGIKSGVLKF
jgi:hypothetical protein